MRGGIAEYGCSAVLYGLLADKLAREDRPPVLVRQRLRERLGIREGVGPDVSRGTMPA